MSATGHPEIEVKYAVDESTTVPDLATVSGVTRVEAAEPVSLEAVYFDTPDRVLVRARIALRRRTGGKDAGWHLKLPAETGRTEVQAPIDPAAPDELPDGIQDWILTRVRTSRLEPIARIATTRAATTLFARDGGAVEFVDDRVTATDVAAGVVRTWREWEVEQVGDDAEASARLLAAAEPLLQAAGARVSSSPAKLAQALGGAWRDEQPPEPETAGEAVRRILGRLTEQLHRDVAALHDGGPREVHAARKTLRRLRSVLALEAVTGEPGARLRERLRPLGLTLGDARDPAVFADLAATLLDALPADVPGIADARRRLVDERLDAAEQARVRAVGAFSAPADLVAFAELDRFVAGPLSGDGADAPVSTLIDLARSTVRRAARKGARARRSPELLHDARRAAKRARYVIEALETEGLLASRTGLRRLARRSEAVHDAIGADRDLSILVAELPFVAARAAAARENAFVYGMLAERGARQQEDLRRDAEHAVARLRQAVG